VQAAGRRAIHVTHPSELRPEWFSDAREVGVTAGTSTLKETVAAIVARLESFTAVRETSIAQPAGARAILAEG
jgi:4-hydroxy-3-methylbut-2-enyl diphosphate reductase